MKTTKQPAQIAGFLYLVLLITGMYSLLYIPYRLFTWGNALETANNIRDNEMLFRTGIVSGIVSILSYIALALVLNKLFSSVNKTYANLLLILVLISATVSFSNTTNQFIILKLISGTDKLAAFNVNQFNALIMIFLEKYNTGNHVNNIFWGLWLLPFGILVYKSGFIPKTLGFILILGSISYVLKFVTDSFPSETVSSYSSAYILIPAFLGELSMCC
jgi:hypothetical protein